MIWFVLFLVLCLILLVAVTAMYGLVVTGRLTIDTGWGRRVRPLGPQTVMIEAPRALVLELVGVPYLAERPPRALRDKVEVVDRGEGMVLAAHKTNSGKFTTVTMETVVFAPPEEIRFRLVRGPVPYVTERFLLREAHAGTTTELLYEGELGTDGWALGAWWGNVVGARWERAVAGSLEELRAAAEAQARRGERRAT